MVTSKTLLSISRNLTLYQFDVHMFRGGGAKMFWMKLCQTQLELVKCTIMHSLSQLPAMTAILTSIQSKCIAILLVAKGISRE